MKALIIYDSFFGNTEQIAQAMGKGLGSQKDVEILRVSQVKPEQLTGLNLLIVGSPTRGFRPTPAIAKFLGNIPRRGLKGVKVAAFDTRIAVDDIDSRILPPLVKVFGYAAKPIADKLQKKEGELAIPPEGFFVKGTEGPLKEGELERAADWAKRIMATQ
jgi:flavodoxin